ncbi:bifunctional DNA primase/polymerase [Mesorhizobium sp. PAMC28654]|uniref:bifunctional DNA primase/polymerase n=1 Tax=Mesorhizobium sp. PAMC28654 TaxID=2880934 RepID=UPI001D0A0FF6|nr:bifunctional DNA primase/polymerase [Mesorhizobium sp. PAMC28654]UDL89818.1 bifunctional DNA primase/polymerase [Mesorhizobium sp. PAMC28654]
MGTSPRLAVARRLAEQHRLYLFPLREGEKLPAIKGWQEAATMDAEQHKSWWGKGERNIGVATGASGLVVIDTDQKEGRDGDANLRELIRELAGSAAACAEHMRQLDSTFTVESPTGSRHYYFRGAPVRDSVGKLAPAVDIRSRGGLVVAPGSTTAKGTYRVVNNSPILEAPQWLIDAIAQAYVQAERVELQSAVEIDTPAAQANALVYLSTADASIQGQGGNSNTYVIACELRDRGISADLALDCMDLYSDWNERCSPPWDRDELAEVIEHAYAYAENSPGAKSIEAEFGDLVLVDDDEPEEKSRAKIVFLTDSEIKSGKGKRRQYVIKGVLSIGDIAAIIGKPGVGKSLIAPYIARKVAQGEPAFGRRTRKGGVFYVAAEDPTGMTERIEALQQCFGEAPGFELVCGVSNLAVKNSPDLKTLLAAAEARRPILIVIDTVAIAFPGIDENSAEGMGRVVAVGRALTKHGAAVAFIHHDTKAGGDSARGHSVFDGALDMRIGLAPKKWRVSF